MNSNAAEYKPRTLPSNSLNPSSSSGPPNQLGTNTSKQSKSYNRNSSNPRQYAQKTPNQQTQTNRNSNYSPRNRSLSESQDYSSRLRKNSDDSESVIAEDNNRESLNSNKKDKHGRSLNHLLNFTYTERSRGVDSLPRRITKKYQPYNKEKYVHATFRFIVKPLDSYQGNLYDPDVLVEWENIEQVIIPSNQSISCPICLNEPIVPRITKCGHVYCLVCIRKYIELGEKSWRRCPICFDAVSINEIKSSQILKLENYVEGDTIRLRLLKREKETNVACPRKYWKKDVITKPPTTLESISSRFSKISLGSLNYLRELYINEIKILEEQLKEAISSDEYETIPFIQMAISAEKTTLATIPIEELSKMSLNASQEEPEHKAFIIKINEGETDVNAESAFSDDDSNTTSKEEGETEIEKTRRASSILAEDSYYMYQSDDGQMIFAHPLMIHMLVHEFGSPAQLPEMIEAKILEIEEHSQNEETRRRYKPFSHLPTSCEFNLCELDLRKIVHRKTIRKFERELKQREEKRKSKSLREERMTRKHNDSVNDLERYLRHFENYNQSFPKPEESLNLQSFPPVTSPPLKPIQGSITENIPLLDSDSDTVPQEASVSYSAAVLNKKPEISIFSKDDFSTSLTDSKKSKPVKSTKITSPPSAVWGGGNPNQRTSSNSTWPKSQTLAAPMQPNSSKPPPTDNSDEDVSDYMYESSPPKTENIQTYTINVGKKKKTVLMSAGGIRRF